MLEHFLDLNTSTLVNQCDQKPYLAEPILSRQPKAGRDEANGLDCLESLQANHGDNCIIATITHKIAFITLVLEKTKTIVLEATHVGIATGLDALVNELKSGSVTLRRCRRKTGTNEALQEMFQILEISQQQNHEKETSIALTSNCNAKLSLTFFNT
uniref:Uncharacterized protein n=1 Tax=Glossina palpalis gambiensis TaxID=67801 RepID=A0A1B0BKY2_9MUSC